MAAPSLLFPPSEALSIARGLRRGGQLLNASAPPPRSPATGSPSSTASASSAPRSRATATACASRSTCATRAATPGRSPARWPAAASRSTPRRNRVIVVRLTDDDIKEATQHRLASALQLALWATPARLSQGLRAAPGGASDAPPRSARAPRPSGRPRSRAGPPDTSRACTSPSFSRRPTVRESALWLRCIWRRRAPASAAARRNRTASRSSTSNSLIPSPNASSASSSATVVRACRESSSRQSADDGSSDTTSDVYRTHMLQMH